MLYIKKTKNRVTVRIYYIFSWEIIVEFYWNKIYRWISIWLYRNMHQTCFIFPLFFENTLIQSSFLMWLLIYCVRTMSSSLLSSKWQGCNHFVPFFFYRKKQEQASCDKHHCTAQAAAKIIMLYSFSGTKGRPWRFLFINYFNTEHRQR